MEGLLRLPEDVRMEAIDSIVGEVATDLEIRPGSIAVSRPRTRNRPQLITGSTADLIENFRNPSTIVDAVISFARSHNETPEAVLDAAFPVLQTLVREGILVREDSDLSIPIDFLLNEGDQVDDFTVISAVSVVADTEVYQAGDPAGNRVAIKMARPEADRRVEAAFVHEASVLEHLAGACSPRLLRFGRHDGRAFIATEWCEGVEVASAAALARERKGGRPELVALTTAVLDAFVELHIHGVVHGDIHPRNVILDSSDAARLIDFGQSVQPGGAPRPPGRTGVDLYIEPELARARLNMDPAPAPTPASDQYALAALLYVLLTGSPTHDFHLSPARMLTQLCGEQPVAFAVRGVNGFEKTEKVLRKALEKNPRDRYATLADFARATNDALSLDGESSPRVESIWTRRAGIGDLLRAFLARVELDGTELDQPQQAPTASLNLGAAGTALALLKISQVTADQHLLAAADAWAVRGAMADHDRAFDADDLGLSRDRVGTVSLHHSTPGVHLVSALVAHAQDDHRRRDVAIDLYLRSHKDSESRDEVGFGLAGLLIGCGLLVTTATDVDRARREAMIDFGDSLAERLAPSIMTSLSAPRVVVGTAHGLAGRMSAVIRWRATTGRSLDETLIGPLSALVGLGQPFGRGSLWPVSSNPSRTVAAMRPTWCNGAAGFVHLWLAAESALDDESFLEHATRAGWTAYEADRGAADLCCGTAGRAYALLALYRRTGEERWLDRASDLALHAARQIGPKSLRRNSLYRGEAGVAVLAAELDTPSRARMPAFEF